MAANLDWSQCPAVESILGKVGGAWVFRGTRVPVSAIFENLKTSPLEEVLENFHVTREQVQTVLDFAARSTPLETSRVGWVSFSMKAFRKSCACSSRAPRGRVTNPRLVSQRVLFGMGRAAEEVFRMVS
jgi:uncharacterized protein (DUF433 family)